MNIRGIQLWVFSLVIRFSFQAPERRYACWGSFGPPVVSAQCPRDTVIHVVRAGLKVKRGQGQCSFQESDCGCEHGNPGCNMPDVRDLCMGRPACRLDVTQQYINTDTCRGFSDYMFIEFNCLPVQRGSVQDICVSDVTISTSGFLRSPNYPHVYPSNIHCECELRTASDATLTISVLDLYSQPQGCSHGSLTLEYAGKALTLCGQSDKTNAAVATKTNIMTIALDTGDAAVDGGFWVKYEATNSASIQMECKPKEKSHRDAGDPAIGQSPNDVDPLPPSMRLPVVLGTTPSERPTTERPTTQRQPITPSAELLPTRRHDGEDGVALVMLSGKEDKRAAMLDIEARVDSATDQEWGADVATIDTRTMTSNTGDTNETSLAEYATYDVIAQNSQNDDVIETFDDANQGVNEVDLSEVVVEADGGIGFSDDGIGFHDDGIGFSDDVMGSSSVIELKRHENDHVLTASRDGDRGGPPSPLIIPEDVAIPALSEADLPSIQQIIRTEDFETAYVPHFNVSDEVVEISEYLEGDAAENYEETYNVILTEDRVLTQKGGAEAMDVNQNLQDVTFETEQLEEVVIEDEDDIKSNLWLGGFRTDEDPETEDPYANGLPRQEAKEAADPGTRISEPPSGPGRRRNELINHIQRQATEAEAEVSEAASRRRMNPEMPGRRRAGRLRPQQMPATTFDGAPDRRPPGLAGSHGVGGRGVGDNSNNLPGSRIRLGNNRRQMTTRRVRQGFNNRIDAMSDGRLTTARPPPRPRGGRQDEERGEGEELRAPGVQPTPWWWRFTAAGDPVDTAVPRPQLTRGRGDDSGGGGGGGDSRSTARVTTSMSPYPPRRRQQASATDLTNREADTFGSRRDLPAAGLIPDGTRPERTTDDSLYTVNARRNLGPRPARKEPPPRAPVVDSAHSSSAPPKSPPMEESPQAEASRGVHQEGKTGGRQPAKLFYHTPRSKSNSFPRLHRYLSPTPSGVLAARGVNSSGSAVPASLLTLLLSYLNPEGGNGPHLDRPSSSNVTELREYLQDVEGLREALQAGDTGSALGKAPSSDKTKGAVDVLHSAQTLDAGRYIKGFPGATDASSLVKTGNEQPPSADSFPEREPMTVTLIAAGVIGCILLIIVLSLVIRYLVKRSDPRKALRQRQKKEYVLRRTAQLQRQLSKGKSHA